MLRLRAHGSHLTCKVAKKYLKVCEYFEVAERNKAWNPSLPALSFESSGSGKKDPDRKSPGSQFVRTTFEIQSGPSVFGEQGWS